MQLHDRRWYRNLYLKPVWLCTICDVNNNIHNHPQSLYSHLVAAHSRDFTAEQLQVISRQSSMTRRRPWKDCLLCCFAMEEQAPTDIVSPKVEEAQLKQETTSEAQQIPELEMASPDPSHSDTDSSGILSGSDDPTPRMHKLQQEQYRSKAMARHIATHLQSLMCLTIRFAALQKDGGDLNDEMVVNSRSVEIDEENSHELGRISDFASEAVVGMQDIDVNNAVADDSLNQDGGLLPGDVPVPDTDLDLSHIPNQYDNLLTEDDTFLQEVLKSGAYQSWRDEEADDAVTNESLWESLHDIIQQDASKPPSTREPSKSERDTYGTPLLWATATGHTFVFQRLLKTGAKVDIRDKEGWTALMHASYHSHVDMLQVLLDYGASVNITGDDGSTALIIAVRNWDTAIVNQLIDRGADFTLSMDDGWTPLMYGSRHGLDDIVEEFLAQGALVDGDKGPTPLILASEGGHQRVVEKLLEHGANVNARDPNDGATALSRAAAKGHYRVVEMLIQGGADINTRDYKDGFTPLMHAAARDEAEIAWLLVEMGADTRIKDKRGERDAHSLAFDNGDEYLSSILRRKRARKHY